MKPTGVQRKVQVWIHSRDSEGKRRVLLLKTTPPRGAFWQPVTGSVDPHESLLDAALREATEESGLKFPRSPQAIGYKFEFQRPDGVLVEEHVYDLPASMEDRVFVDRKEHDEHRWVIADDAFNHLKHPSNMEALRRLLKRWKD